ncbi:MAG TPA: ribosome maturation factor RimM [Terriglobales bacterium]|nr:ribosome maturation factor RimM [Terriglobales bacterium]
MASPADEFVTLARVLKTQGRYGEVAVELHTDVPGRFVEGQRMFALAGDGTRRELQVERLWPHKGRLVLKFGGIDSITQAEVLVGSELQVPRSERASLEAGWTYVSDLIGCTVLDGGREIGTIKDVQFGAGEAPLLIVSPAELKTTSQSGNTGSEYEIPFAEAYLQSVDLQAKHVLMQLPEGMLEINAPLTEEEKRENRQFRSR